MSRERQANAAIAVGAGTRDAPPRMRLQNGWALLQLSILSIIANMARQAATVRAHRNRFGEAVEVPSFSATKAKNAFGALMDAVALHGAVAVTKRHATRAVLLSTEEYERLVAAIPDPLEELRGDFDALVEKMQTPQSKQAVEGLFQASPKELGRVAVKVARRATRRGRSARRG